MASEGRRVVVAAFGAQPLEAPMSIEPMAMPVPAAGEVVIAVKSASVGWVDVLMTSGQYQHVPEPPYTPGLEYAGVVIAGDGFEVGEPVLVDPFLAGPRSHGAYRGSGGFASYALVPAAAVLRIPGALSMDQACNLLGNYETAYHCLVARGRLQPGETVLIHGASGATGLAAVHLAKLLGATVIATGRTAEKLAIVQREGADHVVLVAEMRERVKAITEGRGVDVVYDGVGGEISVESLRCVRFGARFLIVGWASTPLVARGGRPANQLPTNLIMMKGLDVLGCPAAISTVNDPSLRVTRLAQIMAWAGEGKLHPVVSRTYPLDEYREAMRAKWNGEITGGCVLRPDA